MPSSSEDDPDMHFWEEQYRGELAEPFDWFFSFHDVPLPWWRDLLGGFETRVLVLGCGHSKLSEDLYAAGWKYVVSMDSSAAAIAMMQGRAPHLRWLVGDARDLAVCLAPLREVAPYGGPYGGEEPEFDCVLDKGLLDALLVYQTAKGREAAAQAAAEAARVCRAGGRMVVISCLRGPLAPGEEVEALSSGEIEKEQEQEDGETAELTGLDGYGGGRAKAFYCLRDMEETPRRQEGSSGDTGGAWTHVSYREMANPRQLESGAADAAATAAAAASKTKAKTKARRGSIAPLFEDVRPTHYAIIVAERAGAAATTAREGSEEEHQHQRPLRSLPPPPPSPPASSRSRASAAAAAAAVPPPAHDTSLDDYDALYTGALDGTNEPPEPHDAFVSWAALEGHLFGDSSDGGEDDGDGGGGGGGGGGNGGGGGVLTRHLPALQGGNDAEDDEEDEERQPSVDAPFRVLEVGVGTSALGAGLTAALRRRMHRGNGGGGGGGSGGGGGDRAVAYVGVDAVPSAVALQRRHYPDQRLFVADARDLSDRFGAVMLRDWFGEGGAAAAAAAAASGAGEIDLVVDKGTADALFLYADPAPAIDAYLAQVSALLRRGTRSHGLFLVVSCARVDGILTGHGKPLLLEHIDRRRPQLRERNAAFVCLEHRELETDIQAGNRTYDLIVLRPLHGADPL